MCGQKSTRGVDALKDASFELKRGEILGVAGVAGNGQGELIEILTGLHQPTKGKILLEGKDITPLGVKGLFEAGVAHHFPKTVITWALCRACQWQRMSCCGSIAMRPFHVLDC